MLWAGVEGARKGLRKQLGMSNGLGVRNYWRNRLQLKYVGEVMSAGALFEG